MLEFNRTIQEDNPEMIVCHYLPRSLRVQLAYLERVTREMNIISRSESCPEDDEDCAVDERRCDYRVSYGTVITTSLLVSSTRGTQNERELMPISCGQLGSLLLAINADISP